MSLADKLLAVLEENDQEDLEELLEAEQKLQLKKEIADSELETLMEIDSAQMESVKELCKLWNSTLLKDIMTQIKTYVSKSRKSFEIIGPMESNEEYQHIVEANNIAADIDGEIATIHKFVSDKYQKRFPE